MGKHVLTILSICIFVTGCQDESMLNPLDKALASDSPLIRKVMDSVDQYEVQIRYTQIDRNKDKIRFSDFDFQVDGDNYFYPASTVKFPAAVATLEKLNQIDSLNLNTRFYIEGDSVETTFAKAVSEIFAVSDNAANNRLVEFLGQDALNERMLTKGVKPIRIVHRLSVPDADNVTTKPLIIYVNDSTTVTSLPIINKYPNPLQLQKVNKGNGFYAEDRMETGPFDFSMKNYYPIEAQHQLLKRIIFPEAFPKDKQYNLSSTQHQFLLEAMHTLPKNLGYDTSVYYDSYVKFLMFGDTMESIPEHIKIYNKVGYAYGTLTDCAYIKDEKNNVDFMVTATILVNKDGIFNDNVYEYDEIGIPFLAQLGRELYNYELNRKR